MDQRAMLEKQANMFTTEEGIKRPVSVPSSARTPIRPFWWAVLIVAAIYLIGRK